MPAGMACNVAMEIQSQKVKLTHYCSDILRKSDRNFPCGRSAKVSQRQLREQPDEPSRVRLAQKALLRSSRALCRALAKATPAQRRCTIERLPMALRLELIRMREAQQFATKDRPALKARWATQSSIGLRGACQSVDHGFVATTSMHPDAGGLASAPSHSGSSVKQKPRHTASPPRGNVWTVQTAGGLYYRVRLSIGRVLITSGRMVCSNAANEALSKLRHAASCAMHAASSNVQTAAVMNSESDLEARLHCVADAGAYGNLQLTFQVVLDVRRWLGRRMYSEAFHCIDEALATRRKVLEAESQGATAVCQLWWDWTQAAWHTGGRARKPTEVEAATALNVAKRRYLSALKRARASEELAAAKRCRLAARAHRLSDVTIGADQPVIIASRAVFKRRHSRLAVQAHAREEKFANTRAMCRVWKLLSNCSERAKLALARVATAKSAFRSLQCKLPKTSRKAVDHQSDVHRTESVRMTARVF